MAPRIDRRRLLIALNAADTVTRGALCRLAADPDRWIGSRGAAQNHQAAARIGVPTAQLRKAQKLVPRAETAADAELAKAAIHGCKLVVRGEPDYPACLEDLTLPPPVLYVRGRLPDAPAVAVVGARKADRYGLEAARWFGQGLADVGITVISGFAVGVDAAAHRGALAASGGTTVAVLGCGLDVRYPHRNRHLVDVIAERGALITEYAFGSTPRPWRFPVRNRLIAALSLGTLVVQARARSGSLNTAHHALELGRDVYAVPGRVFDTLADGPNGLLADGALVARDPRDVIESLPLAGQQILFPGRHDTNAPETRPARPDPLPAGLPGQVLGALSLGRARPAEDLAAAIGSSVDQILGALLELELGGRVRREPGPVYSRLS